MKENDDCLAKIVNDNATIADNKNNCVAGQGWWGTINRDPSIENDLNLWKSDVTFLLPRMKAIIAALQIRTQSVTHRDNELSGNSSGIKCKFDKNTKVLLLSVAYVQHRLIARQAKSETISSLRQLINVDTDPLPTQPRRDAIYKTFH